jgi:hypothetical protein
MSNHKDNPESLSVLMDKLGIVLPKRRITMTMVNKKKITLKEYQRAQNKWKHECREQLKKLHPYYVGTYKDWEGDGYFTKPVYYYEGIFYG